MTGRYAWQLTEPARPLQRTEGAGRNPGEGEVLLEVAGCGVCHTDLSFFEGRVATRGSLPLVLGHEISGTVVETGPGAEAWESKEVIVASIIPCGECEFCLAGRSNVCLNQLMCGNDIDGGFATHVTVPARGLTQVPALPDGLDLATFAVVADAVTTPLQAVRRADVDKGDFAVVVGTGGVGSQAVQIAAASGAQVVAIDIDDARLDLITRHGAVVGINARDLTPREVRDRVQHHARVLGASSTGWKVFECSGTTAGQETAFALVGPAAILAVVGFTRNKVSIRLSNLMAFDAIAFGSWGCPIELYPEAIDLVVSGKVALEPFVRKRPLDEANEVLTGTHRNREPRRVILVP